MISFFIIIIIIAYGWFSYQLGIKQGKEFNDTQNTEG